MKEQNSAGLSSHSLTSLLVSGVLFLFQQPLSHLTFFSVVGENLFVFKRKINEFSVRAAMLLKIHMGRKCRRLQREV